MCLFPLKFSSMLIDYYIKNIKLLVYGECEKKLIEVIEINVSNMKKSTLSLRIQKEFDVKAIAYIINFIQANNRPSIMSHLHSALQD